MSIKTRQRDAVNKMQGGFRYNVEDEKNFRQQEKSIKESNIF